MTEIPKYQLSADEFAAWCALVKDIKSKNKELKPLKTKELLLRKKIIKAFFPNPKEGVNRFSLDDTHALKCTYKLSYDIDEPVLQSLNKDFKEHEIPLSRLLKYKASLVLKDYRALEDDKKALFNQAVVIKPATSELEIESKED